MLMFLKEQSKKRGHGLNEGANEEEREKTCFRDSPLELNIKFRTKNTCIVILI